MDAWIAQILDQLAERGRLKNTRFVFCSDHGHTDGRIALRLFDVEREIFHARLGIGSLSSWHKTRCPDAPARRFGAVNDADGCIGILLPKGHATSEDLATPNTFEELRDYLLADGSRVNVVELFTEFHEPGCHPADRPVDFAVLKIDDNTTLIHKSPDSQALIHARRAETGGLEFRYEPLGGYPERPERIGFGDPLGYLGSSELHGRLARLGAAPEEWLDSWHSGRAWLEATAETEYPGCVDALGRFFRYDGTTGRKASLPDLLLFARSGWAFRPKYTYSTPLDKYQGTHHGNAFRDTTRICMFFSGPGIRKGHVLEEAHWITDILPTVMEMQSMEWRNLGLDGEAIAAIWETATP